jgi:hypothetical protein
MAASPVHVAHIVTHTIIRVYDKNGRLFVRGSAIIDRRERPGTLQVSDVIFSFCWTYVQFAAVVLIGVLCAEGLENMTKPAIMCHLGWRAVVAEWGNSWSRLGGSVWESLGANKNSRTAETRLKTVRVASSWSGSEEIERSGSRLRKVAERWLETADAGSFHSRRRVSTAGSEDPLPIVRLPARNAYRNVS